VTTSTNLFTEGEIYGVFNLTAPVLGVLFIAILVFAAIAAGVALKYHYIIVIGSQPSRMARSVAAVSCVLVFAFLGALLVTWWTVYPWGTGDDSTGVFLMGLASVIVLALCAVGMWTVYEELYG